MSKRRSHKRRRRPRPGIGSFPLGFGRFLGKPISSIPLSYLRWALKAKGVSIVDKWAIRKWLDGPKGSSK